MCGICGIYEFGHSSGTIDDELIVKMRDTMVHRGPDSEGSYVSKDHKLGFGFRRLAIIDLSEAGNQPMTNEDGTIWLVFNGEIYNHLELRNKLIERGHTYRSKTDSETLVHLYEEYGCSFVEHLQGMFAIALWDSVKQELILVRDRIGVKPLYYTITNGRIIFASEIKAILEHPSIVRDVDKTALYHYLTFFTTPAPQTLFKGIKKLPAGHILKFDFKGNVHVQSYWDAIVQNDQAFTTEEDCIEELRELLISAVKKRMMSDVPFGVFLSGGVDSSANVAIMAECSSEPVRTFTVGFKDLEQYNELQYAHQVAKHFNTNHHEILIGPEDVISFLPQLIYHQDEPIADPVCVPLYYVSKLVRDSDTVVVQVGEGSDEIFCGYSNYVDFLNIYERGWKSLSSLPNFVKRIVSTVANPFSQIIAEMFLPKGKKLFPDLVRRFGAGEELFWGGTIVFDEISKARLLKSEFLKDLEVDSSHLVVKNILEVLDTQKSEASFLERMTYLDLKLRLAELLLMRVDKITMATSVEARVPFLDHLLVEFAMKIPRSLKYKNGQSKYILKKALEGILPNNIIYRKKQGFALPVEEWFRNGFGNELEDYILGSGLRERNYFNYDEITRLLYEHKSGKINYGFHLWGLLNLSLWYERWLS